VDRRRSAKDEGLPSTSACQVPDRAAPELALADQVPLHLPAVRVADHVPLATILAPLSTSVHAPVARFGAFA
jgi:hypothetical protein